MSLKTLRSNAGLTYVGTLVMVVLIGIMAARAAVAWKMRLQREKEVELIFRGMQYMNALRLWYWPNGIPGYVPMVVAGGATTGATTTSKAGTTITLPANVPPDAQKLTELKDLLTGSGAGKKPCLRKLYLDPITGKEFNVIRDASQRIIGVASSSELEPVKQANFPFELNREDFEGKKKYSDWQFICTRWPTPPGTTGKQKGLPSSGAGQEPQVPPPPPEPQPQPPESQPQPQPQS